MSILHKINNAGIFICFSVFFILTFSTFSEEIYKETFVIPYEFHGAILKDTSSTIEKKDIQRINYSSMFDILNTRIELFGMPLGINGHFNNFLSYGSIDNNINFANNCRLLSNHSSGNYNIENLSPEYFERIEILKGSEAAILSPSPANTYLNFQEIIYNTKIPFTRLWYAQEGGSFIGADGIFSQNFSDGWNFTFGFKKFDDRLNFENMSSDYWNIRATVRYNFDSTSSLSLSDNFVNNKTVTSGGSNPANSFNIYSAINSTPFYQKIQLRNYRHDLNLTYSKTIGNIELKNIAYYTSDENLRGFPRLNESDTLLSSNNIETQFGSRLDLNFNLNNIKLKAGGNIYSFDSEMTNFFPDYSGLFWNLFSKVDLSLDERLNVSGGLNLGNDSKASFFGFGERLSYKGDDFNTYIDHSYIENNGLVYSTQLKKELTNLFIASVEIKNRIKFESYFRITNNPIFYRLVNDYVTEQVNLEDYQAFGASVSYSQNVLNGLFAIEDDISVNILAKLNKIINNQQLEHYYPLFVLEGKLNYKLNINQSELNIGIRGGILDSKTAPRFIPISNSYILTESNVGIQTTGLSLYSIMKLGNAYVKIEWENILDANYYYVSFYPERGQIVKLSVAWSFFD